MFEDTWIGYQEPKDQGFVHRQILKLKATNLYVMIFINASLRVSDHLFNHMNYETPSTATTQK